MIPKRSFLKSAVRKQTKHYSFKNVFLNALSAETLNLSLRWSSILLHVAHKPVYVRLFYRKTTLKSTKLNTMKKLVRLSSWCAGCNLLPYQVVSEISPRLLPKPCNAGPHNDIALRNVTNIMEMGALHVSHSQY